MISARNWRAAWQRTYPKKSASRSESFPDGASCATRGAVASLPLLGGVAGILGSEGAGAQTYKRNADHPFFAAHPKYHFVMDNHVTTNSFFTATIYGCQDFCALTGCTFTWTGSENSVVSQMVSAMDSRDRLEVQRHRRAAHRQRGLQRPDGRRAQRRHSCDCLQRRRRCGLRQQPAWPMSASRT